MPIFFVKLGVKREMRADKVQNSERNRKKVPFAKGKWAFF